MTISEWVEVRELTRRFRDSICGVWDSSYFTVGPGDELLMIGEDGTGSISGMCNDLEFTWEPAGPGQMRILEVRHMNYGPDDDPADFIRTEPFDCRWRFGVKKFQDGHKRVEMRLSHLGIEGYQYSGPCKTAYRHVSTTLEE
ncbi:MAG TPA: hypothetical protein VNI20_03125 [Fimbriimonadaceae bacterium]|nr:hypothetical protein [Fimbriimonadaceae bacterium]